jgi:8-hydroxy-5-deazaflavin:NADPH oxidoreductase
MKIAIIGSGKIGSTAARLFIGAGHEVAIANRRGPQSLKPLRLELGAALQPASTEDAIRFGDVVLVAVPLYAIDALPAASFAGKIVVDANNYYPNRDGHIPELDRDETTSSELLARHLPGARVVKAFNTMYYATLGEAGDPSKPEDDRLALFVAGDDQQAKQVAIGLIEQLGFAAMDTGSLADGGRRQQPGSPIYNTNLTGAQARAALGR